MVYKFKHIVISIFFLLGVAQCGKSGNLSKNISFDILPNSPIIVTSKFSLPDPRDRTKTIEIAPPWFVLNSRVTNNTTQLLYLVTYSLKGTTIGGGQSETFTKSIDPGFLCQNRKYLAVIQPGDTYERVTECDPFVPASGNISTEDRFESLYVTGLPDNSNLSYSVEVSGQGWFVDGDGVPIERLVMEGFVVTQ